MITKLWVEDGERVEVSFIDEVNVFSEPLGPDTGHQGPHLLPGEVLQAQGRGGDGGVGGRAEAGQARLAGEEVGLGVGRNISVLGNLLLVLPASGGFGGFVGLHCVISEQYYKTRCFPCEVCCRTQ